MRLKNNTPEIDTIIRSNRRSFSLEVKPDGRLIVRAPKFATKGQIQVVIEQRAAWIEATQKRLARQYPSLKPKTFTAGEAFWYLGEQYPLQFTNRGRPLLELDGVFRLSEQAKDRAKDVFIEWYREETRAITQQLIEGYIKQYHFDVNQVRITSARTRWGSCSGRNNLNFTYRLCMAPLDVVDYVVVHELAHLKIRNHSKAFWKALADIKPGYRQQKTWLKQHGALLTLD